VKRRTVLILCVLVVFAAGGTYGYNAWQENKRNEALDALINSPSCDACAARKKGVADKAEKRKEQSLLEELQESPEGEVEAQ
jgi:hypothetical protein